MIFVVYKEKIAAYEREKNVAQKIWKKTLPYFFSFESMCQKYIVRKHYSKSLAENFVEDNKYL